MRVLMISLDRGLFGAEGSGDVIERHQKYADAAGALDIIVFAPPRYDEKVLSANLKIYPTRSQTLAHFRKAGVVAGELAKINSYDLLVTQEFAAPVGARLKKHLRLPWLVNIHSMFFTLAWLKLRIRNWYLYFRIRSSIKSADGFRVNNEVIKQKLLHWGITRPILVQPTPIDIGKFRIPSPQPFPARGVEVKVLYVGRLAPEKNVAMLIRAFKNIKGDFEFWIVGKGSEEEKLKTLASQDPRIKFLGGKTFAELPAIFQGVDIFVLPSNTESFGQVLLQAAASGCAIIATRTPGALSILGNEEGGVLIPVGSQRDLEFALGNLLSRKYEREYWSKQALDTVERYDSRAGVENTVEFWRQIADEKL